MIQVGGHDATRLDFEIPARYGLSQTIADTLVISWSDYMNLRDCSQIVDKIK